MKRVLVTTVLAIIMLLYTGCDFTTDGGGGSTGGGGNGGGSGNTVVPTTVSGRVVDQAGNPLEGIKLSIGLKSVTTVADGAFKFTGLIGGKANLTGRGGQSKLYQLDRSGLEIVADKANELGDITAYMINGVGAIKYVAQNRSVSQRAISKGTTMQFAELENDIDILTRGKAHGRVESLSRGVRLKRSRAKAPDFLFLQSHASFIELKWEKIINLGIVSYKVVYAGKDGSGMTEIIWESANSSKFDLEAPEARLMLERELWGKVKSSGEYFFRVRGFDSGGNQVIELPKVKVSFGMLLNSFPNNQLYNGVDSSLSWSAVPDSSNYRVKLMNTASKNIVFDQNQLTVTNCSFSSEPLLNKGTYYASQVLAYANDADGWPLEKTIDYSGFTY